MFLMSERLPMELVYRLAAQKESFDQSGLRFTVSPAVP